MTVELSRTNMHVAQAPVDYTIGLGLGHIEIVVADAVMSSGTLMTMNGDFIACDTTLAKDGVLKFNLHKADAVTLTSLSRLELQGHYQLMVKKLMHRKEEMRTFLVNISR